MNEDECNNIKDKDKRIACVAEIREQAKQKFIQKWEQAFDIYSKEYLHDTTDIGAGNFVSKYIPNFNDDEMIYRNIDTIQYHLRMLGEAKKVLEEWTTHFMEAGTYKPLTKEESYATQRIDNAMTLLEDVRADLLHRNFITDFNKIHEIKKKKDILQLDDNLHELKSRYWRKNGYVRPYIQEQQGVW